MIQEAFLSCRGTDDKTWEAGEDEDEGEDSIEGAGATLQATMKPQKNNRGAADQLTEVLSESDFDREPS